MKRIFVIASAIGLAAMGATFAACSGDDSANESPDSGSPDTSTPSEDTGAPTKDSTAPTPDSTTPVNGDSGGGADAGTDAKGTGETDASDASSAHDASDAHAENDASDAESESDAADAHTATDASDASSAKDSGGQDASDASSETDSGGQDASDASADAGADSGVTLTVMNFDSWCSITVNGGTPITGGSGTATFAPGSKVTLVATADNSCSCQIGADPWFGVDQNDGGAAPGSDSGTPGVTEATVTIGTSSTQCVSVCCQLPGNGPPACPTVNPCP